MIRNDAWRRILNEAVVACLGIYPAKPSPGYTEENYGKLRLTGDPLGPQRM
jgi:hypothetical protein